MKNEQFDNLKKRLDDEVYRDLKFSKTEKDEVMIQLKTDQRKKTRPIVRWSMSVAAIVTLLLFGGILLTQGLDSTEKANQQTTEPSEETLASDDTQKDQTKEDVTDDAVSASGNGLNKEWKDVSDFHKNDPENDAAAHSLGEFIQQYAEELNEPVPVQYEDDPVYYRWLAATVSSTDLRNKLVDGEAIEKDFKNLFDLTLIIHWEQINRYLPLNKEGNPMDYRDEWLEPSDRLIQAIEYSKQLTHDLNVVINKDGQGETYGVAHMLDGEKATEVEQFIQAEEFKDMWIED
ncbi:hypothetical protein ACSVDE_07700 [Pseudalkalibacillus sp. Hm43]|uniref:hypothetical protein n=1 Tax=Pseudalkalibacillus sp. Hm43 TaxID=3450742 RepID=UPI003F43BDBB